MTAASRPWCGDRDPGGEEDGGDDLRVAFAELAAGHRPVPLRGVPAIGFGVHGVVEEVRAAGGEAERDERDGGAGDLGWVGEHPRRTRRRDHQQVLQPLLR
jgi:hypothetical protein